MPTHNETVNVTTINLSSTQHIWRAWHGLHGSEFEAWLYLLTPGHSYLPRQEAPGILEGTTVVLQPQCSTLRDCCAHTL